MFDLDFTRGTQQLAAVPARAGVACARVAGACADASARGWYCCARHASIWRGGHDHAAVAATAAAAVAAAAPARCAGVKRRSTRTGAACEWMWEWACPRPCAWLWPWPESAGMSAAAPCSSWNVACAQLPQAPQPVATPSSNCSSSKLPQPSRTAREMSRSETRWQMQMIMDAETNANRSH
jgi:hypothetical protein